MRFWHQALQNIKMKLVWLLQLSQALLISPAYLQIFNLVDAQEASTHKIEAEQEDDIQAQTSQLAAKSGLLDGLNFFDVDAVEGVSPAQESQTQTTDQTASSNLLAGLNVANVQSTQVNNETYEVEQTEAVE